MVRFIGPIVALAACRAPASSPAPPSHRSQVAPAPAQPPIDAGPMRPTVTVTSTDDCGMIVDNIYFPEGSIALSATANAVLDQTAQMFVCFQNKGEHVSWQVGGNTDDQERDPLALSEARAHVVAAALVSRGVAETTLIVRGFGATRPLDRQSSPLARAKNRRVDFLIQHGAP